MNTDQAFTSNKTADSLIFTGECTFKGLLIQPDGVNDVTISLYDNTSATGNKIIATLAFSGTGGAQALQLPVWVRCSKGIYANITTAGTVEYTIFWSR